MRGIFGTKESGERLVRRNDVGVDGVGDLLGQALLIFGRNAGRILLRWQKKWIGVDNALTLDRELFQKKFDWHEVVLHAGAKHFGGLAQDTRDLMKTRDVVLILLYRIEGN